jgi:hypothetical protein
MHRHKFILCVCTLQVAPRLHLNNLRENFVLSKLSEIGQPTVEEISEHLRTYLVEASSDGAVITVGKLNTNKHTWRH